MGGVGAQDVTGGGPSLAQRLGIPPALTVGGFNRLRRRAGIARSSPLPLPAAPAGRVRAGRATSLRLTTGAEISPCTDPRDKRKLGLAAPPVNANI